ncbi:hypothetical protein QCA50_001612 [Cerrena zonata]|uniref:Uncharacterized protein n=1 Tax=Cerrena zonata TaxID=2478898 RepID=A0AAW0GXI6_9APHY
MSEQLDSNESVSSCITTHTNDFSRDEGYTPEAHIAWRLLYRLWRLDEASRAFHGALKRVENQKDQQLAVFRRWKIGLILEVEDLEKALAHMCISGLMTTRLSNAIHRRLDWLDYNQYPPSIDFSRLPDADAPSAPDLTELFDGVVPQIIQGGTHWWNYNESTDSTEDAPYWWADPSEERWSYNVSVPRDLVGQYVRRLTQSQELLSHAVSKLRELQDEVQTGEGSTASAED